MLIIAGKDDHAVPPAVAKAAFGKEKKNAGVTEYLEKEDRGDALTIDSGWRAVADNALAFVQRFA